MTYLKVGVAILGVGGMAGGGYLLYPRVFSENKKTILDVLKSENKFPISNNESQWTLKKDLYNKNSNDFRISTKGVEKTAITVDELREWCSDKLKEYYFEGENSVLSKIEKWCLKPNIKEALSKETQGLIPFDGTTVDNGWSSKLSTHNGKVQGELIGKWKLTPTIVGENSVSAEILRDACRQKIEKEYLSETDEDYIMSKTWCLSE